MLLGEKLHVRGALQCLEEWVILEVNGLPYHDLLLYLHWAYVLSDLLSEFILAA